MCVVSGRMGCDMAGSKLAQLALSLAARRQPTLLYSPHTVARMKTSSQALVGGHAASLMMRADQRRVRL
jgi:hypothetical protein